jgi:hypothetical protein
LNDRDKANYGYPMTTAKLPAELYDHVARSLSELRPEERMFILFTDLKVLENGDCWLKATAELKRRSGINTIEVRRDSSGLHVTISSDIKYLPGTVTFTEDALPVASITVEETH